MLMEESDDSDVIVVMSDMDAVICEPWDEVVGEESDIGAVLGEAENEASLDDSDGEASADASNKKAMADGSDISSGMDEEKKW